MRPVTTACQVLVIDNEAADRQDGGGLVPDAGATSLAVAGTEQETVNAADRQHLYLITSGVHLPEGTGPVAVAMPPVRHGGIPVPSVNPTYTDRRPAHRRIS